jgi:hypothetical protein
LFGPRDGGFGLRRIGPGALGEQRRFQGFKVVW